MLADFQSLKAVLFAVDLIIHYLLLAGIIGSLAFPARRIWPPPKKNSWQHRTTWILFYMAFSLNGIFIFLDWNSWIFTQTSRLFLGVPVAIIGLLLVSWGIRTLGVKNTSGLKHEFITGGPYRFTRNPQYLGDMLLFIGMILITHSSFFVTDPHLIDSNDLNVPVQAP